MKIDHCIHSLLYDHDCVIIPDLGGFVANKTTSQVNPAKHVFYPPSRRIAFNASLKKNDGLLATHIAQEKNINFETACNEIKNYTTDIFYSLQSGQRYTVEKVGAFQMDAEKNIQFTPDFSQNFLFDSYGLSLLHAPVSFQTEASFADEQIKILHTKTTKVKLRWLELIPVAAVLALIFMIPAIIPRLNSELSNLFPFEEKKTEQSVVHTQQTKDEIKPDIDFNQKEAPTTVEQSKTQGLQTENSLANTISAPENLIIENTKTNELPEKTTAPIDELKPVSDLSYHIVVGCFRIEENAVNLETDLKSKGMSAIIIGKNERGLTMVSAASFASFAEAENELSKIKIEVIPGAWILKK